MDTYAVSRAEALEIVSVFQNAANVIEVQVIGSVAREQRGNDLDLVLVVDPFRYASFVKAMSVWSDHDADEDEPDDFYGGFRDSRREAALRILELEPLLAVWLQFATRNILIDLFLMPEGWEDHIDEIQDHLPHDDPQFVGNIVKDVHTPQFIEDNGARQAISL